MKSAIIILASLLLTACTTFRLPWDHSGTPPIEQAGSTVNKQPSVSNAVSDEEMEHEQSDEDESEDSPQEDEKNLPSVKLNSDLMYEILVADFAYQSGNWEPAFDSMMGIAQKTRDPRAARRAAEMAVKAQNVPKSLASTRLWYQLSGGSEEAERYYLAFLVLGDELKEAQPLLARRLKDAPPEMQGAMIFQLQRLLSASKNKPLAFLVLEDIIEPYSSLPESHIALSLSALSNNDRTRARQEADRALAIKPNSELAALASAQAIADPGEATKSLSAFLATYPNARQVRIAYARMLIGQKKYEAARAEFEKLLASKPHDPLSLYSLGILSLQGNDSKSAEKYLTDYLNAAAFQNREEREQHQVLFLLAQIAEEQGDHATAIRWLERIEREPGDSSAYIRARIKSAQILAAKGDISGARKLLSAVHAETASEQEQVILAEAQLLRDAGQSQQAYAVLSAGIEQLPDNVNLLYDYALAADKLGKTELMEQALRRILSLDPTNFHAYNALGYSLADRKIRLDEAYALVDRALKLAPDDPFILDSMGWVLYRQGKMEQAEERLRQAYGLRQDAEIAAHLGEVLWMRGQNDEAIRIWSEAGKKEPGNELLKSTLKRFNIR